MAETARSDMGVGLGLGLALLAVVAAAGMLVAGFAHDQLAAAYAFALAMLAGSLSVAAFHVYQ